MSSLAPAVPGPDRAAGAGRVVVAMSGGVDSSVAAALLVEQGHEVIGVTLQLYDHGEALARKGACCAGQDIHDARRVADRLDIAHYVLDFEERFRRAVIEDFAAEYARGRTPIPCVRCNQRIKFKDLLEIARTLGADALATGHYVRRIDGPEGPELHRAAEGARDQSYYLFATTAAQLEFLRFPLGDMDKSATRALARRHALPVADKPDSQDICFVPSGRYDRIVGRLRPDALAPGEIVDQDGRTLGRHEGVGRYTVGQRRGLGVAAAERLYVTGLDPERRRVVVGPRQAGLCQGVEIADANWLVALSDGDVERPVAARHRAQEPFVPARLMPLAERRARVEFEQPRAGVAPGQACVLYDGSRVMGGGWIERTLPAAMVA